EPAHGLQVAESLSRRGRSRPSGPELAAPQIPKPDAAASPSSDRAAAPEEVEWTPDRRSPADAVVDSDGGDPATGSEPALEAGAAGPGGAVRAFAAGLSDPHGHQEAGADRAGRAPDPRGSEPAGEGRRLGILPCRDR